ncbi:hypothetical protein ACFQAT_26975 [Undibacterium arcticum]|uniref:Uncharacterized protein n=1 Tax=Undibacterium arcticum TaxID=1762892 RepID=A0ABV7EWX3_9BURK
MQLSVRQMISSQYLFKLLRGWTLDETYNETVNTSIEYGGASGIGLIHATSMFGAGGGH